MANLVSNIDGVLEIYDDGTININHSSGALHINSTEVLNSSNDGVFGDVRLNSLDFGDVSPTLTDGGERLLITTTNGWVTIGAENTSYAHLNTDRASFYFNKKLVVNSGAVQSYDEDLNLNRAGSETARLRIAAGTTTSDQDFSVTGDVTITGNLTVSGTETTVNTATLTVEDSVILLNSGQTTPVNDIGMVFQRFSAPTSVNYNPVIMWEEASDRILFGATTELGADIDVGLTAEWMTVTGTGLVGIGTDSPNAHLHVNRGTTAGVYFYGGSNDRRQLVISSGTGDSTTLDALHDINASSTAGVLTLSTAGAERMRINSAGNITTTGNFDVTGNIAVSGTVEHTYGGVVWQHGEGNSRPVSRKLYSEAGSVGTTGSNITDVYGEADLSAIDNNATFAYAAAWEAVETHGARLPTLSELLDGVGMGSGQSYDSEYLWTCTPAGPHHVWVAYGSLATGSPKIVDITDVLEVYRTRGFFDVSRDNRVSTYSSDGHLRDGDDRVFHDGYHPNADILTTARSIALTGAVTGTANFDGSVGISIATTATSDPTLTLAGDATGSATFTNLGNATLTVAIADDSHNHTLANIDQVTINNTNDLDTYNTRGLYNWSSTNPANSPAAYGSMIVLPDGSQSQQLLQTHGGTANQVSLYGRRKTSGTWDTTWTQYFSDHYHPNADTLTTARNINGVAFNGSIDITVADATKLPLAGGTLTGDLAISNTTPVLSINDTNNGSGGGFIGHIEFNNTSGESFRIGDWAAVDETSTGGPDVLRLRNSNGTRTVFEWGQAGTTAGSLYAYNQRVFADDYHPNADTLTTARNINGVAFDGSIDITVVDTTKLPLAGGTVTGDVTFASGANIHRSTHSSGFLVGGHNNLGSTALKTNPIYTIGTSYQPTDTTLGNMYGIGFAKGSSHLAAGVSAMLGTGWGMYVASDGDARIGLDGTNGIIRSTGVAYVNTNQRVFADNYHPNADTLTTARTINGVSFNGSIDITVADATKLPLAGGTMTGPLIVDTDNNANGGLRLLVNQTNPQQDFYFAQEIVSTLSGSTVTTSDREQGGIWLDLNSTATGGGTSHEHRVYGAYLDVDSTGDADMVYGVFADATVTPSTGQTSQVTGGYFRAEDNGGAGAVSSVFGVQGIAWSDNATSDTNTLVAGYFKAGNAADTGNVTTASAVYGEIEIVAGTGDHYGTSYVFQAQYDNNDTVAQTNTTYLYYGNYAGVLPTTAYGVYIADAVTNYFGGTIRSAGDVVAYYSDERLKDFHGTIPNAMDKVKQLNGYYFTENQLAKDLGYNNDSTQVGVSAQEVEAVLPEIVKEAAINTEKGTDYKTVQYEKLTALLIEAVKEQQTEIDELKKLVKDLMSR